MRRERGTGTIDRYGYLTKYINGRRCAVHRYIFEQHLGRPLLPDEIVHHINENKLDNRIENLELMSRASHMTHHKKGTFTNSSNSRTHKQCPKCLYVLVREKFPAKTARCKKCTKEDRMLKNHRCNISKVE